MDNIVLQKRTIAVLLITLLTMAAEIYYGICTHSMGLTADGFHMGTHAVAFAITLVVCILASKFHDKEEKLNALGGYTSAILLGFTALGILYESIERLFHPLNISFEEAILVAIIGLVVNLLCIAILGGNHLHLHVGEHSHEHESHHHRENLNYKATYLHIAADAMTSVLAILALYAGKLLGLTILDPIIGVVGGIIIARWAANLLAGSSKVLLDIESSD